MRSLPSWGTHNNVMRACTHTHQLTELDCLCIQRTVFVHQHSMLNSYIHSTGPLVERQSTKISSTKDFTCSQGPVMRKTKINNWIQRGREHKCPVAAQSQYLLGLKIRALMTSPPFRVYIQKLPLIQIPQHSIVILQVYIMCLCVCSHVEKKLLITGTSPHSGGV